MNNTSQLSNYPVYSNSLESSIIPTNESGSFFSKITLLHWIVFFLILAILGFNIFIYIGKGTQSVSQFITPYTNWFFGLFGNTLANTTTQAVNTAATGSKAAVDITANTINSGVNVTSQVTGSLGSSVQGANASSSITNNETANNTVPQSNEQQQDSLTSILNKSIPEVGGEPYSYGPDNSSSSIQNSKATNKSGWCYIGEERGYRSCSKVGQNDTCMSGDIFPSQDICVNPSLRP